MLSPTPVEAAFSSSRADSTCDTSAKMAAMAPPPGSVAVSSPLAEANRTPSSMLNTPAACAAASSPRLCPSTTLGVIPTLFQRAVSAHSMAKMAGCVHSWSDKSPARPNITSSNEVPRASRSTASHWSRTARTTGSVWYRCSPIPTHWLPCPVYTNAILEGVCGAGLVLISASAFRLSRSDAPSLNTMPAR